MSDTIPEECFVIGPIGDDGSDDRRHADWLLDGIIKPVFSEHFSNFVVTRSDKISDPGSITSQIIVKLKEARLVIADMSRSNANAFYELGIRHFLALPTIHLFMVRETLPFDVGHFRAMKFSYYQHSDIADAQLRLKAVVEAALKQTVSEVQNPVTQAFGTTKFEEAASEPQQILEAQLTHLTQHVQFLSDRIDSLTRSTPTSWNAMEVARRALNLSNDFELPSLSKPSALEGHWEFVRPGYRKPVPEDDDKGA